MSSSISKLAATLPSASPFNSQRRKPINNGINFSLKAKRNHRGSEVRDNLDHLQRASKLQQAAQIPKKRIVQSAPLGSWDRFPSPRTIQQMMDTMDSLIDDPFAYTTERSNLQSSYRRGRTPWEIKEKKNKYELRFDMPGMTKSDLEVCVEKDLMVINKYKSRFDMPGMTKSDLKVCVEKNTMVIKAEKMEKEEGKEEEEEEWSARSYGRYNLRIALPENAVVWGIWPVVKDGVLYVTIPKPALGFHPLDSNPDFPATVRVFDIAVR